MRIQENLEKSKYEADGSIQIQGTTIPYHTICEDHFFVDEENEWTVYTEDGSLSAQWEYTVAVTEDGVEIITH